MTCEACGRLLLARDGFNRLCTPCRARRKTGVANLLSPANTRRTNTPRLTTRLCARFLLGEDVSIVERGKP